MSGPEMRTPSQVGTEGQALKGTDSGAIVTDQPGNCLDKAVAAAVARAAMAGVPIYRLMDGSFMAVWGVTRVLPDLAAVEAFLRRVGAGS